MQWKQNFKATRFFLRHFEFWLNLHESSFYKFMILSWVCIYVFPIIIYKVHTKYVFCRTVTLKGFTEWKIWLYFVFMAKNPNIFCVSVTRKPIVYYFSPRDLMPFVRVSCSICYWNPLIFLISCLLRTKHLFLSINFTPADTNDMLFVKCTQRKWRRIVVLDT